MTISSNAETWKPIPGWPSYEVSDRGRIRSVDRTDWKGRKHKGRVRVIFPSTDGRYLRVMLGGGNTTHRTANVQNLVAEAFLGPRPKGMTVSHLNGDGYDNRLTNLIYETLKANHFRKRQHGTHISGKRHWYFRCPLNRDDRGRFQRRI